MRASVAVLTSLSCVKSLSQAQLTQLQKDVKQDTDLEDPSTREDHCQG